MTEQNGQAAALTDDRLLRRNVLLNLGGWVIPAGAALVAIPLLAQGLGPARFGMVALAWAAVGLFSFFDFGLGRALTRMIAERAGRGDLSEVPDLVWTSAWIVLGLSGVLTTIGVVGAPFFALHVLKVPVELQSEAIWVVRWLAIGIAPMVHGVVLRGVLEATQKFGMVNRLRVPLGVATYLGPLLAIPLGGGAATAVAIVVIARTLYWVAHFFVMEGVQPGLGAPRRYEPYAARELFRVGGWITVSNIVSPIIVQADRWVIAASLPIAASGWYGAASEIATKQWLFTAALQPVLFSALSATLVRDRVRSAALMERGARITMLVLFPVALGLCLFAVPGMKLWLGTSFSVEIARVLPWIAVGVFVNAAAQVAYAALQGGIDSRSPALLHLIELPLYFLLLIVLTERSGVQGAAAAFLVRMVVDGVAMWGIVAWRMPAVRAAGQRLALLGTLLVSGLLFATWLGGRLW